MRHKLMQVMMERDREHPLGGSVQLDDVYLGGERSGGKRGRGAPGKTPFVAAVETNDEGHPLRMKLTVVEGFRLTDIAAWAQQHRKRCECTTWTVQLDAGSKFQGSSSWRRDCGCPAAILSSVLLSQA